MCNDNNDMTCIITTDIHAAINTLNSSILTTEYYHIHTMDASCSQHTPFESNVPTVRMCHDFGEAQGKGRAKGQLRKSLKGHL